MSRFFHKSKMLPVVSVPHTGPPPSSEMVAASPPEWTAAAEPSHTWGLRSEATDAEYETAEIFCQQYPLEPPRFVESRLVDQILDKRAAAWQIDAPSSHRFRGGVRNTQARINISTSPDCGDFCLMSNLPIIAGHYSTHGQYGIYYEITVNRMDPESVVAIGSVCRPYPEWRLPGWNRQSTGLHLDDMRKFFEDPNGGRDYTASQGYLKSFKPEDIFGFGYEFDTGNIFFTRNGGRLPTAFIGKYLPLRPDDTGYDVYAAVGVSGRTEVMVNFGAEPFAWKEANVPQWRVECHVGRLGGPSNIEDVLPAYAPPM